MKSIKKFDMSKWEMGTKVEELYSKPCREYIEEVEKMTESLADELEDKFDLAVREGVSMALTFICEDKDYCLVMFSTFVDEFNPKGDPVIKIIFGDETDYVTTQPLPDFLEMCNDDDLQVIAKAIIYERSREHRK